MKKILIPLIAISLIACKNTLKENIAQEVEQKQTTQTSDEKVELKTSEAKIIEPKKVLIQQDSVVPQTKKKRARGKVRKSRQLVDWELNRYILKCPKDYRKELEAEIENMRNEWKDIPLTLYVTFKNVELADYLQINFVDENGKEFDFGFGNNNFGDLKLYDKGTLAANKDLIGKEFKINWGLKRSEFSCCSGEYKKVEAFMPSIYKIELLED
ncbi:hypothetical protein [Aureivirga sp. CE67]|uniref:hypothetical protein n=1 Tax=Aureivirga sp. CE67 TaxID=1788983 RepID=UPI0018CB8AB0|nr:hypothetical protein [Aureivirga sp. CE67]